MASISSLSSSSSSSSIYGNRTYNIISGLASGLDTEELISGAIQGYQQKIQNLQKENTTLQWKQEAYQSVSDKLVEFYRNYATFGYSDHNLASNSFFSSAVTTTTNGTYANLISASGKTSSNVVINAVNRLATAARYSNSADRLNGSLSTNDAGQAVITGGSMSDLTGNETFSKLAGSLTLNYGDRTVSIEFGELELFEKEDGTFDADAFKSAIEKKLREEQISTSDGSVVSADTLINVTVDAKGNIGFSDKSTGGNTVSIADATGSLKDMIKDYDQVVDGEESNFSLNLNIDADGKATGVTEEKPVAEYLAGKTITVSLDDKSKTITLPTIQVDKDNPNSAQAASDFQTALQDELDKAFGKDRVTVELPKQSSGGYAMSFTLKQDGSTLAVTASDEDVGKMLGIGTSLTSYVDTTKTLEELNINWNNLDAIKGVGTAIEQKDDDGNITGYVDEKGNRVDQDCNLLDENGNKMYHLEINGVEIGTYTKDTELNTVINAINSNTEAGVNVSYSKTTGQFVFTAKDTGAGGQVEITGGLASELFGSVTRNSDTGKLESSTGTYEEGVDAQLNVTINGENMNLTRSSNSFDLDGMNVTLSGTFNEEVDTKEEAAALDASKQVTFTSKTDADKIVEVVKQMVEDLNAIIKEVKGAYSDMPLKQTDGSKYEPLTDEDMSDMSESAIEAYEEKAKTGILFMDSDLSSLYNDLRNAITSSGADGVTLRSIGIETSYSDGLTTLTFNEQTFREALESDPDKVQEAFTKSKENGAATDGLMATLTSITDKYAATSGDVKGILIEKAGSKYAPSAALDNDILDQMEDVEEEIAKWQDKMSNKVDYYTNKFTQLEMLINQMNSQSSTLSGLLSG